MYIKFHYPILHPILKPPSESGAGVGLEPSPIHGSSMTAYLMWVFSMWASVTDLFTEDHKKEDGGGGGKKTFL